MNTAASSGSSSPSSISIRADSASTIACRCVVAGADPSTSGRRAGEVALADVEQHEHRLLGEEPEAAERLLLVGVERLVADRAAGLERRLEARQDDLLALVRLALGGRPVAPGAAQPLEPAVDHREVGEDELEVELLEVAGRVDGARRVRLAAESHARTTWISASESRSRARCSAGSSSAPTRPSVEAGGAGRST